jgi:hypothetical protein
MSLEDRVRLEASQVSTIFVGTVTVIKPVRACDDPSLPFTCPENVTFRVRTNIKRADQTQILLLNRNYSTEGWYNFKVGQTYLVYAYHQYGNPKQPLTTSLCTRTAPVERAAQDLGVLLKQPRNTEVSSLQ